MKIIRSIAINSDMHTGTDYSLAPRGFRNKQGRLFALNPGQKMLLKYWNKWIEICEEEKVDTVLHLADYIHGQNPRGKGIQLMTTNVVEQIHMNLMLIEPLSLGRKNYFVQGSEYHSSPSPGMCAEEYICDVVGKMPNTCSEWWAEIAIRRFVPFEGYWQIQHGESGAFIYQATALDRENLHINAAMGTGDIDVRIVGVIKGHWHRYISLHENNQHHIQACCWCAFMPYKYTLRLPARMQPSIGGVILKLTDNGQVIVQDYRFKPLPKIVDYARDA